MAVLAQGIRSSRFEDWRRGEGEEAAHRGITNSFITKQSTSAFLRALFGVRCAFRDWRSRPGWQRDQWLFSSSTSSTMVILITEQQFRGRVRRISRVNAFRPKGYGFDSRSSRHVRALGKSFTHSCLWRSGVKFRHSIRAVSGAPLSGGGLKRLYRNGLNEW